LTEEERAVKGLAKLEDDGEYLVPMLVRAGVPGLER
jgi:hypothetical protein